VDTSGDDDDCGGCGLPCRGGKHCCGGQCTDLSTDADNCGECGHTCGLPNVAAPMCIASGCINQGCESFFADCDHDPSNGCEVNLTHDPMNCYGCGQACPVPANAAADCTVSGCGMGACLPGWTNCNHLNSDGCEYATAGFASDSLNCGGCGVACPTGTTCVAGVCK
jgi:hypothetical protein